MNAIPAQLENASSASLNVSLGRMAFVTRSISGL